MKTTACVAAIAFSFVATVSNANGKLATYAFGASNYDTGAVYKVDATIVEGVDGSKVLNVKTQTFKPGIFTDLSNPVKTEEKNVRISKILSQELIGSVEALKGADVTVEKREYVCLMFIAPGIQLTIDHLAVANANGELILLDGPKGCYLSEVIMPQEEYLRKFASTLKIELKALALATIKE
jgi:hypothetical protein